MPVWLTKLHTRPNCILKAGWGVTAEEVIEKDRTSAACGSQGLNKFCDLVYLSAEHPDRILTCGRGLESIVFGRQKRDGETGLCFTPVGPFCCLRWAASMPDSARAGRCRHLSGALHCPGLLAMFALGACDKSLPDSSRKEGTYLNPFQWRKMYKSCKKKTNWRKNRHVSACWMTLWLTCSFTWTTHTHTFTADALICPLWSQTRTHHVGWGRSAAGCIIWDHSEVALPSPRCLLSDLRSHITRLDSSSCHCLCYIYGAGSLYISAYEPTGRTRGKLWINHQHHHNQMTGNRLQEIGEINRKMSAGCCVYAAMHQTVSVFERVCFLYPSRQCIIDLDGPVGIVLTADRDTRGPAISQT